MSRKFLTPLQLPADPVNALEAVTKQYADGLVVIAATDPIAANPSCELWYDTTDPGVSFPNMPRGYIAASSLAPPTNQVVNQTNTDINGSSFTWTAESSRRYRLDIVTQLAKQTSTGLAIAYINNNGADIKAVVFTLEPTYEATLAGFVLVSGLSGVQTTKVRGWTTAAGLQFTASGTQIAVEDIGGV